MRLQTDQSSVLLRLLATPLLLLNYQLGANVIELQLQCIVVKSSLTEVAVALIV